MTLTGIPAVIVLLAICAVLCAPVWLLSLWVRDWAMRRLERRYRRDMADLGVDPEVVDEDWRKIAGGAG